jgi:hypothetical protein
MYRASVVFAELLRGGGIERCCGQRSEVAAAAAAAAFPSALILMLQFTERDLLLQYI